MKPKNSLTKIFPIFFLCSVVLTQVYSPSEICPIDEILILNENSQSISGHIITQYPSGNKRSEFPVIDGKLSGIAKWWYESGELLWELSYMDNELDGSITGWYPSGKRRVTGQFTEDVQVGYFKWWDTKGIEIVFAEWDSTEKTLMNDSKFIPYSGNSQSTGSVISQIEYPDFIFSKSCGVEWTVDNLFYLDKQGYVRLIKFMNVPLMISVKEAIIQELLAKPYRPFYQRDEPCGNWGRNNIQIRSEKRSSK